MVLRWTIEEDQKLIEIWSSTFSYKAVSEQLNRSYRAVSRRMEKLRNNNPDIPSVAYKRGSTIVPCGYARCDKWFIRSTHGHKKYCSDDCKRLAGWVSDPNYDYSLCPRCKVNPKSIRSNGKKRSWCKSCESKQKGEYCRTEAGRETWRRWYDKKKLQESSVS